MEGSAVTIRFLDGSSRSFEQVLTVDALREAVAEELSVRKQQVVLMDGCSVVLRVDIRLQQLAIGPEFMAVIQSVLPTTTARKLSMALFRDPERPRRYDALRQINSGRVEGIRRVIAEDARSVPDARQWVCARLLNVYGDIAKLADSMGGLCTRCSCPRMCAGKKITYRWQEPGTSLPPQEVSAPDYTAAVLLLAHRTLGGPAFAPEEEDLPMNDDAWMQTVKLLVRRFTRVFAHAYLHHLEQMGDGDVYDHLSYSFKHFLVFVKEFDLLGADDLAPIKPLVKYLIEEQRILD